VICATRWSSVALENHRDNWNASIRAILSRASVSLEHRFRILNLGSEVGVANGEKLRVAEAVSGKSFLNRASRRPPVRQERTIKSALGENHPQRLALKFPVAIHKGVIFEHMSPAGYILIAATVSTKFMARSRIRDPVKRGNYTVRIRPLRAVIPRWRQRALSLRLNVLHIAANLKVSRGVRAIYRFC
jgi:hypothetical protein